MAYTVYSGRIDDWARGWGVGFRRVVRLVGRMAGGFRWFGESDGSISACGAIGGLHCGQITWRVRGWRAGICLSCDRWVAWRADWVGLTSLMGWYLPVVRLQSRTVDRLGWCSGEFGRYLLAVRHCGYTMGGYPGVCGSVGWVSGCGAIGRSHGGRVSRL